MVVNGDDALRWRVIQTKPRCEGQALARIVEQGFRTLLPSVWQPVKRKKETTWIKAPMFPGYLFVKFSLGERWGPIQNTRGVARILCDAGGRPAHLPHAVVEDIRVKMDHDAGAIMLPAKKDPGPVKLERGKSYRVERGAFASYNVVLLSHSTEERVNALLDILGRPVKVEIPVADLASL